MSENEKAGKELANRAMEIGRDGAYLEIDVKDLALASKSGELDKAKIVVLKTPRVEMSDPVQVETLKRLVDAALAKHERGGIGEGFMDDDQIGFLVFREIFEKGLASKQ